MTIADLKQGMIIELRNGKACILSARGRFITLSDGDYLINKDAYFDDLTVTKNYFDDSVEVKKDFDIVKIGHLTHTDTNYYVKWEWEREKALLDDSEKKYLSSVIAPFKDRITYICKRHAKSYKPGEFLIIKYCEPHRFNEIDFMSFPSFGVGTRYKGLVANKQYALAELGL